jgi:2-amino-4-hydroxy-6-hydroxymethyldihydropteridine diphosphokinase
LLTVTDVVLIALGTNLGDREQNLAAAKSALLPKIHIERESSIYETAPWGYEDQPDFLNQVIEVVTDLRPRPLLRYLKKVEEEMGRLKTFRNGPRLIDLDILFYGQKVIKRPDLKIPHPRLQDRAFVLVPLAELVPDLVHPVLGESIKDLLAKIDTSTVNRL